MPENDIIYSVRLSDGRTDKLTQQQYDAIKDKLFADDSGAEVVRTSLYNQGTDDGNASDVFHVRLPDGRTDNLTRNQFNQVYGKVQQDYPGVEVYQVSDMSDQYWRPKLDEAQKALSEFDGQHGKAMSQYESMEMIARNSEMGEIPNFNTPSHKWLAEHDAEYKPLKKQRDALREAVYTNPIIRRARIRDYEAAMAANDNFTELADKATSGTDRRDYNRAAKYQREAARLFSAPSQYDEAIDGQNEFVKYIKDYEKGAGKVFNDYDFWSRGLTQITRDIDTRGIRKKVLEAEKARGAPLDERDFDRLITDAEKAQLMSYYNYMRAQADRANDLSSAYTAGTSFAESLGYMAEFMLSQGLANVAGKALSASSNGFARWMGQALMSEKALNRAVAQGVTAIPEMSRAAKIGTEIARPIVQGLWHTGTQISTLSNMASKLNETNDAGELNSWGRAIWLGFADSLVENWSESFGNTIDLGFEAVGKGLGWAGDKVLGKTTFGQMARYAMHSPFTMTLKEAGFNGFFGEMMEEWAGNAVRLATGLMDKDEFKQFASIEQQLEMAASFAPMSIFGLAGNVASGRKFKKEYEKLAPQVKDILLKNGISQTEIDSLFEKKWATTEDIAAGLAPYAQKVLNSEEKGAKSDYATILRFAQLAGADSFNDAVTEYKNEQRRGEMQSAIQTQMNGRRFWMEQEEYDKDGNPVRTEDQVRVVTDAEGNRYYVTSSDAEGVMAFSEEDGRTIFLTNDEIASDNTASLKDYLQSRVEATDKDAEAKRMYAETQQNLAVVKQRIAENPQINIGTQEAPRIATVVPEANGQFVSYTYKDEEGRDVIGALSWKEVAGYLGMPLEAKSDEQITEETAADMEKAEERKNLYNRIAHGTPITVMQEMGGEAAEPVQYNFAKAIYDANDGFVRVYVTDSNGQPLTDADNNEVWFPEDMVPGLAELAENTVTPVVQEEEVTPEPAVETPVPAVNRYTNEQGKVNQSAFMNHEPAEWAQWNDERNQDGGADTVEALGSAISTLDKEIDALIKKRQSTSNPDDREAIKEKIAAASQRRESLASVLSKYAAPFQEEAPVQEVQQREVKNNAAPAAQEEKTGYRSMSPREAAMAILTNENFEDNKEALSYINGFIKRAKKALEKIQKAVKAVKAEDFVDPAEFKQAREAVESQLPPYQEEVDFWSEVMNEAEKIIKLEEGEMKEPKTLRQLIANVLHGCLHGLDRASFVKELGLSDTEINKLLPFWAKKGSGLSVQALAEEVAAEDQWGLVPMDRNADQADTSAVRDEILNLFMAVGSVKEIIDYTENENRRWVEQLAEAEEEYAERALYEAANAEGMTVADYVAREEEVYEAAKEFAENYDEINAIFVELQQEEDEYRSLQQASAVRQGVSQGQEYEGGNEQGAQVVQAERQADGNDSARSSASGETGIPEEDAGAGAGSVSVPSAQASGELDELEDLPPSDAELAQQGTLDLQEEEQTPASEAVEEHPEGTQVPGGELTEAQKEALAFVQGKTAEEVEAEYKAEQKAKEKEAKRQEKLRKRAEKWKKFLGEAFDLLTSEEDIMAMQESDANKEAALKEARNAGHGWYSPSSDKAYIYLPNIKDASQLDRKILHEVLTHKGLLHLMGREGYNRFLDSVWKSAMDGVTVNGEDAKSYFLRYVGGSENSLSARRAAADEFLAYVAEHNESIVSSIDKNFWSTVAEKLKEIINDMLGEDFFQTGVRETWLDQELEMSFINLAVQKHAAEAEEENRQDMIESVTGGEPTKEQSTQAVEKNPQVPIASTQEKYEDFGEKIGMARKDTAQKGIKKGTADGRPAWAKKYNTSNFTMLSEHEQKLLSALGGRGKNFQEVINDITKGTDYGQPFVGFYDQVIKSRFGNRTRRHYITDAEGRPIIFTSQEQFEATMPVFEAKDQGYRVREKGGKFQIVRAASNGKQVEYAEFDAKEDAVAYLSSPEGCTDLLNRKRENYELPALEKITRNGMPDYRGGKNVTPDDILNTFGFRGGEFGNWLNAEERQQFLNYAYDSLMDLANLLGISPRALSLGGELSLAFGARGKGSTTPGSHVTAHYESDRAVINLTKLYGAGSLAHEWAHALDNYFGLQDAKRVRDREDRKGLNDAFLTEGQSYLKGTRKEVRDAVREVMQAIMSKRVTRAIELEDAEAKLARDRSWYEKERAAIRRKLEMGRTSYKYNRKTKEYDTVKYTLTEEQLSEFDNLVARLETDPTFKWEYDFSKGGYRASGEVATKLYELIKDVLPNKKESYGPLNDLFYNLARRVIPSSQRVQEAKEGKSETVVVKTDMLQDSEWFDRGRAGSYWSKEIELFARAFETYLAGKMKEQGKSSDYLTYMKAPLYMASWDHAPYPQGEELTAVSAAFDKLFQTIQEKTDEEGKTLLFSKKHGKKVERKMDAEEIVSAHGELSSAIGRRLSEKEAALMLDFLDNTSSIMPSGVPFTRENYDTLFSGGVETPLGKVKMGEGQYDKFNDLDRDYQLAMAYETLTSPDTITEKPSKAKEGQVTERPSSFIYIKTFHVSTEDGEKMITYYNSVSSQKQGLEIVMSNYAPPSRERVKREYKEGSLAYIKEVTLPSESATSTQGDQNTVPGGANSSSSKDSEKFLYSKANAEQKVPGKAYVDEEVFDDSLRFSLSKNNKKTVETWLKKREDISDEQREALVTYLDTLDNPTLQLATAKWYAAGVIRIPEDMPKVEQAVAVAGKAKVDPLQYKNPMELIDAHADIRLTEKRINPDDVPTLRRAKEYPEYGIVVYDVEDSDESRENMRRIINTHFGKEASPWCLLQGDGEGNLTEESANYWRHYNAYPKQVAFKDGKLLAFSANSTDEVQWWDRNDEPSEGIPVTQKMPNDALGRTATYNIGADGRLGEPFNMRREYKENGVTIHESWHDNGALAGRREEVDGVLRKKERYYPNGQKRLELNFNEKGERDGLEEEYFQDGTPKARGMWKNNLRVGEWQTWFASGKPHFVGYYNEEGKGEGSATEWYESGKKRKTGSFVNGEKYGEHVIYWENGQVMERSMYSDGKLNGVKESWFENGMPRTKEHFKDGHPHGEILEYEDNGTLVRRKHYKDSRLVGKQEAWYPNGNKYYVANYNEEGKQDGVKEMYGYDGNLSTMYLYKDGNIVEETSYNPNGTKSRHIAYDEYGAWQHVEHYDENGNLLREKDKSDFRFSKGDAFPVRGEMTDSDGFTVRFESEGGLPAKKGLTSLVERTYQKSKMFSFMGKNKIESAGDVAFIFKELETAAVENSFIVFVKDGIPTILHTGIGDIQHVMIDESAFAAGLNDFAPDEVYMVHNHPSGRVEASRADISELELLQRMAGKIPVKGVIIDTVTGEYGLFDNDTFPSTLVDSRSKDNEGNMPLDVQSFDKMVFSPEYRESLNAKPITGAEAVASYLSAHRLGEGQKVGALLLDHGQRVVGNLVLNENVISNGNAETLARQTVNAAVHSSASNVILFGDFAYNKMSLALFRSFVNTAGGGKVSVQDVVRVEGNHTLSADAGTLSDSVREEEVLAEKLRFSKVTDKNLLDELNSGKTFKAYRAMAFIEDENGDVEADLGDGRGMRKGRLYSPMATQERDDNGRWRLRQPTEMGAWEQSDEHPDKAVQTEDGKWVFRLKKPDGSTVDAAYNPYIHTSLIPLNDQFTSAHKRPELVTVEVEVPESELTSGYKAEKAKDSVGKMSWHSGPVAGQLPEGSKREVVLSRYDRPIRVVPNSEVADKIVESFKGVETQPFPWNVFTPALREELSKRGVKFSDKASGTVSKEDQLAYEESVRNRKEGQTKSSLLFSKAYHGTDAEFDRFDLSYAGSGEGVWAHGYGQYFSLDESVGRKYAYKLGGTDEEIERAIGALSGEIARNEILLRNARTDMERRYYDDAIAVSKKRIEQLLRGERHLYTVELPDDNGENYIDEKKTLPKSLRKRIANVVSQIPEEKLARETHGPNWLPQGFSTLANIIEREQFAGLEIRQRIEDALGNTIQAKKETSKILHDAGFVGMKYEGGIDGPCVVIFDDKDIEIVDHLRFSKSNQTQNGFVSNAEMAAAAIPMQKATPEQWAKMIEKAGGLKAGEDKWLGLSDWLRSSDKKTLTKQEVLDYINENKIQIEEVHYAEDVDMEDWFEKDVQERIAKGKTLDELQYEINELANSPQRYDAIGESNDELDDYLMNAMKDTYGDDFEIGYRIEDGEIEYNYDPYSVDSSDYNQITTGDRVADSTRINYTTEGLSNKREIAMTVPTIEPWNEDDDIHFGDAGDGRAIAWIRFGDTTFQTPVTKAEVEEYKESLSKPEEYGTSKNVHGDTVYKPFGDMMSNDFIVERDGRFTVYLNEVPINTEGTFEEAVRTMNELLASYKPNELATRFVLVIDEIQSKRHQEGREKGYADGSLPELTMSEWAKLSELKEDKSATVSDAGGNFVGTINYTEADGGHYWAKSADGRLTRFVRSSEEALEDLKTYLTKKGIPGAPFEKNWHELAMKRMLRYAAENGYDYVAWTTGDQQAERYSLGGVLESITKYEDSNLHEKTFAVIMNGGQGSQYITTDDDGNVIRTIEADFRDKTLADIFGKDMAVRMLALKDNESIEGEGLRVGGEGMRGFYDDILPRFMNKYGKKWGVKVEDIELPNLEESARTMHAVPVTQEMKESVLQGQLMFSKEAEAVEKAHAGGIGAVVGKESVGEFYMDIYKAVPKELRGVVVDKAMGNGMNFRKAISERLSVIARKGFENDETGLLLMAEPILSYYAGEPLGQNATRYILWRGERKASDTDMMDVAEDIAMRRSLKIGTYAEPMRFAKGESAEINMLFNANLERFAKGEMLAHEKFNLGVPGKLLVSASVHSAPMQMTQSVLREHIDKHGLSIDDIRDLPNKIQQPIMVYRWGKTMDNVVIITAIRRGDDRVTVALRAKSSGGEYVVNDIRSIHGKDAARLVADINSSQSNFGKDNLKYVDKEKVLEWFTNLEALSSSIGVTKPELLSATKVVKEFENPKLLFSKGELKGELDAADTAAEKAVDQAKETLDTKKDELRNHLLTAMRAMSAQKEYDKATVETVASLAKALMRDQYIDSLNRREVSRLLGIVRSSVGKSPKMVKRNADALVEMVIDNLLRREREGLEKLTKTTGTKTNTTGVVVQGELDVQGQKILKAYKEGITHDVGNVDDDDTENTLYGMRARLAERLESKDDAVRKEAEAEDAGLQLAIEYRDGIKALLDEEKQLEDTLKDYAAQLKAGDMSKRDYEQNVAAVQDAIRDNHVSQVETYRDFRTKMQEMMSGSIEAKKSFVEREKERKEQIQHYANSDMQGKSADAEQDLSFKGELANSAVLRFFTAPLGTFDQMLRMFGRKSVDGEGYLWNKFMRDWHEATSAAYLGQRDAKAKLDEKVSEVFGREGMKWTDLFKEEGEMGTMTVSWRSADGEMKEHELSQGQLLYILMVDKMADGRMKLRKMGIMEEDVAAIRRQMDERFIELADWLQNEYLVELRNKYNAVHERLFGASMDAIDNYFPLVINKRDLNRNEDISAADTDFLPSTTTGSIIKRRRNNKALDLLNADAFSVVLNHIDQMETWAAFAEFNKDLNTLLSYKRFRNQVQNMATVYGAGPELWKNLKDVCRIAGNAYVPAGSKSSIDSAAVNLAKGVTSAKINFRVYTAIKQFLSMPAFLPNANMVELAKDMANPIGAWKWAMENLPMFEKRWKSRIAGDTRLMTTDVDWKVFRSRMYEKLSKLGMSPNAFVDAWTVAVGAHAMYKTKYAGYIRDGYTEEQADKRAKQDAAILYNETQQSSESAFVSTAQIDRTLFATAISAFRNSSMGYQRQLHDALRNLGRMMKKGYKEESIAFMTKQMMRDGLTEEQAAAAAERKYKRAVWKNLSRVGTFGFLVQFAWNLGGSLAYLLLGDDDDEKNAMLEEAFYHALASGTLEGLAGGNVMSDVLNMVIKGENLRSYDPTLLPIIADIKRVMQTMSYDKMAGWNELVNLAVQAGIGVNPQTLSDAVVAVVDACNGDMDTSSEAMLLIMRVLQVPQSQLDKIYIDELGMDAGSARKMSYSQMAERYANYKLMKNAGILTPFYSDELEKKRKKSHKTSFKKKVNERKKLNKEAKQK